VTFWIPNFGLVHFKIICQALIVIKCVFIDFNQTHIQLANVHNSYNICIMFELIVSIKRDFEKTNLKIK
jgi:hypothetical protein